MRGSRGRTDLLDALAPVQDLVLVTSDLGGIKGGWEIPDQIVFDGELHGWEIPDQMGINGWIFRKKHGNSGPIWSNHRWLLVSDDCCLRSFSVL